MAYQSLYRRYRSQRFAEIRGQDHVVRALRNAVRSGTVSHAYLFSGPRGTGKTSTARILAKALNCEAPVDGEPDATCDACRAIEAGSSLDVVELDAASNRRIDEMRQLLRGVALSTGGRTKVYILDEVHQLTDDASSALLKTLEEPPAHVVFVLATTDPQKVLPTIRSRTQHLEFRLLSATVLFEHLRWVAEDAGLDLPESAIELAVRRGGGSARDALSALDQITASGEAVDDDDTVDAITEALCERDPAMALTAVAGAASAGRDPRRLAEGLLAHLRDVFLSVLAPDVVSLPDAALERVSDQGRRLGPAAAVRAMDALGDALVSMRDAPDPRVSLEVALVRVTRPDTDTSPAALLERIERLERAQRSAAPVHAAIPAAAAVAPPAPPVAAGGRSALGAYRRPPEVPPAAEAPLRVEAPPPAEAAAPVEAREPAEPSTPAPLPSRDELTLAWPDAVLGLLRPSARGLLGSGRFVDVGADAATYALPGPLLSRAVALQPDVEAALAAHFGRPVPLRLVADTAAPPSSTADDEPPDLDSLRDAPPDNRTGIDRLTDAFPGAEVIEG